MSDKIRHGQRPPRSPALCRRVDRLHRGCDLSQNISNHRIRIREGVVMAGAQRDLMRSVLLDLGIAIVGEPRNMSAVGARYCREPVSRGFEADVRCERRGARSGSA